MFEDTIILITGGTGSFGRCMLKTLLKYHVKEVRIFSRDEEKQLDVQREVNDDRVTFWLGDVRDFDRVLEVCEDVDILFHAAAQKIIDSCEAHPVEAFKTNVNGTWNVKRAALACNVHRNVLISTDKAVKPINFYGMTKGIAEKIWLDNHSLNKFMVVRYGNVIGSRGSVVPFFQRLIKEQKPLPITDSKMTRFLLTLEQAINLVLQTTLYGEDKEIYVPDLSACNILDLAYAMGGKGYPLKRIGIRQGEKIHECLIQEYEMRRTGSKGNYYIIRPTLRKAGLSEEYTSNSARQLNQAEIKLLLKEAGL
jgi:FlaA1/EpsC-like NDP-sugar epimerase